MAIDMTFGSENSGRQHRLLQMLYPKYRLYNDEYFGGRLPGIPILLMDKCMVGGREAWGKFDCKATYSKITRRVIEIKSNGEITLLTKYNVPEEHYLQTLLHEMIHAYIILVLKRYPKDPHGELFMEMADTINAQEGLDIKPENEMVSQPDVDSRDLNDTDSGYGNEENNDDKSEGQLMIIAEIAGTEAPFKYWVTRCRNKNMANSYKEKIRKAFKKSTAYVRSIECGVPGFSKVPDDVNRFYGFGANTPQEMCDKLGKYCGTNPEEFYRFFGLSNNQQNNSI